MFKVYFDAGLKQVAMASGFRSETLTSLQKCSNFKCTQNVIFEAMYVHMFEAFLVSNTSVHSAIADVIQFDQQRVSIYFMIDVGVC